MLKKDQRIGKHDLIHPTGKPRFSITPYFSLRYKKQELGTPRFAFIISKKVDKKAVVRNALKRRMIKAVSMVEGFSGYDAIFYLKKESLTLTTQQLQDHIRIWVEKQRL